jgi:hypothetical protein
MSEMEGEISREEVFVPRVYSVPCFDFTDKNGNTKRVSAIIAPIRLMMQNRTLFISWGCSKVTCRNTDCRYSKYCTEREESVVEKIR